MPIFCVILLFCFISVGFFSPLSLYCLTSSCENNQTFDKKPNFSPFVLQHEELRKPYEVDFILLFRPVSKIYIDAYTRPTVNLRTMGRMPDRRLFLRLAQKAVRVKGGCHQVCNPSRMLETQHVITCLCVVGKYCNEIIGEN